MSLRNLAFPPFSKAADSSSRSLFFNTLTKKGRRFGITCSIFSHPAQDSSALFYNMLLRAIVDRFRRLRARFRRPKVGLRDGHRRMTYTNPNGTTKAQIAGNSFRMPFILDCVPRMHMRTGGKYDFRSMSDAANGSNNAARPAVVGYHIKLVQRSRIPSFGNEWASHKPKQIVRYKRI